MALSGSQWKSLRWSQYSESVQIAMPASISSAISPAPSPPLGSQHRHAGDHGHEDERRHRRVDAREEVEEAALEQRRGGAEPRCALVSHRSDSSDGPPESRFRKAGGIARGGSAHENWAICANATRARSEPWQDRPRRSETSTQGWGSDSDRAAGAGRGGGIGTRQGRAQAPPQERTQLRRLLLPQAHALRARPRRAVLHLSSRHARRPRAAPPADAAPAPSPEERGQRRPERGYDQRADDGSRREPRAGAPLHRLRPPRPGAPGQEHG